MAFSESLIIRKHITLRLVMDPDHCLSALGPEVAVKGLARSPEDSLNRMDGVPEGREMSIFR